MGTGDGRSDGEEVMVRRWLLASFPEELRIKLRISRPEENGRYADAGKEIC